MAKNILVCDDDKEITEEVLLYCKECLGSRCEIVTFNDGKKLLEYSGDIDLLVLDIEMPGMNGIETFDRIKALDASLPVIFLTASGLEEDVVCAIKMGAVDYLSSSARELADYLGRVIAEQLERSVQAGQQYREDSDYIGSAMEEFNDRAERLKSAIDQIAVSISSISGSIDGAASGISGAAGSTRILVDDMEGITGRMDANQEIVGELQKQMDMFANL